MRPEDVVVAATASPALRGGTGIAGALAMAVARSVAGAVTARHDRLVPPLDNRHLPLPPGDPGRGRAEQQQPAADWRKPNPTSRQHPQQMPVGEAQHVAVQPPHPGYDPVSPMAHVRRRLAVGNAVGPQGPAGPILSDRRRGQSFVVAVVPLGKVLTDFGDVAEPRERASLERPLNGLVRTRAKVWLANRRPRAIA